MKSAARKSTRTPRNYDASRRREAADRTRAEIVTAAAELLKQTPPDQLSYVEVAIAAEVGLRTVYRHFPEPADLLAAVAEALLPRLLGDTAVATDRAGAARQLANLHQALCREPTLYPLFFAAPLRSQAAMTEAVKALCGPALNDLSAPQQAALCGLIDLFLSPYAWQILHRRWGLPADAVTQACLVGMQAVFDAVAAAPGRLDSANPAVSAQSSKRKSRTSS